MRYPGFAIAASAAAIVATTSALAQPLPCGQGNNHCLTVTVAPGAGGAPEIRIDVPELNIYGPNHVIFWRINNTGAQRYRFPSDGIAFKTADGQREFRCAAQATAGTVFKCTDPNAAKGRFEYGIKLTGTPAVQPLDPFVINR